MERLAPVGAVYQAGTLSGNPVAMTAGLVTLERIAEPGFFDELGEKTRGLAERLADLGEKHGIPVSTNQAGGMFGFFFSAERPITRYSQVVACDLDRFKRFFHGMLEKGIYLAPSAFETGFMSAAHKAGDIEETLAAAELVFKQLGGQDGGSADACK